MSDVIRTELDADGVLVASIDMPGKTMNVFSVELMDALDALMDRVDADAAVRSCVVTSGKASFLAGADLVMVRGYTDAARTQSHDEMFAMCGRLGRQFVRLEESAKPWIAAVNGLALGGGLELALACRERHVAGDPALQLGVPEVRWGLLPGAGGTQRLPRLAPFDSAMEMLLTGRSIDPAAAARLGIASAVVPPAEVVTTAKAAARALHGVPYDVTKKFGRLAQSEVPAHSAATARAIAREHSVSDDDFERYPAYGAIVDSVLLGARLPLAEATTVEMEQFLRLMFDPVAGRMVRSLFLERLRADRELAPNVGIERLRVGPVSAARSAWTQALSKLKLPQEAVATLPADTADLVDQHGRTQRIALRVLDEEPAASSEAYAVLAPLGPYGRVIEIVGTADAAHAAGALAVKLRALPWRTPGPTSLLQTLRGRPLEEQQRIAVAALPAAGDPAFIDVAACLSGVSPAWTGGPLSWQAT